MEQSPAVHSMRPQVSAQASGGAEALVGLLITLGSGAFYFLWKSQAGIWKTSPMAAISYLIVLVLAVACQQELLRLPWPGMQQGAGPFLAASVTVSALGHFDFTAATIGYAAGAGYATAAMIYRLGQTRGLRNLSFGNAFRSLTNLVVLLGGTATLVSLYFPWQAPRAYQILVNNKQIPLSEVDPRFLTAMKMSYLPRTAFATSWVLPIAALALGMVVWAMLRRTNRTPGWYAYAPLITAGTLTVWGLLAASSFPGPYIFGAGVLVLVLGGLMAGIRGQLEAVKHRYRTNG